MSAISGQTLALLSHLDIQKLEIHFRCWIETIIRHMYTKLETKYSFVMCVRVFTRVGFFATNHWS